VTVSNSTTHGGDQTSNLPCTGTPVKTFGNLGSRTHFKSELLRPWLNSSLQLYDPAPKNGEIALWPGVHERSIPYIWARSKRICFIPGASRATQGSDQGFQLSPTKNLRSDIIFFLKSNFTFHFHVEIGQLFHLFLRSDISSF